MSAKVIQVPIDEELLSALDLAAREQGTSRSELIRVACRHFLTQLEERRLDQIYQRGYRHHPETPASGEVQVALAAGVLSDEDW